METKTLKNKIVRVNANTYGALFLSVYSKNKDGNLVFEGKYKFDNSAGLETDKGVDLEISIPKGCRREYAKIIKLN